MTENIDSSLIPYVEAVTAKKATDVVLLDVRNLTSYADYLIVASGTSTRQVSSIAEHIKIEMNKKGNKPVSMEGLKEGEWALLDYGDIIIHIFIEESREFYDIEGLWADAEKLPIDSFTKED